MAAVQLSGKAIGSIVKIKENGTLTNFIVLKHGYPTSGNGRTLLLREVLYDTRPWDSGNNIYVSSDIDSWLNSTYLNLIDADIRSQIAAVSIPLSAITITRKVFLLSYTEVGLSGDSNVDIEGSPLAYFNSDSKRIAYSDNSYANGWWLRSPRTDDDDFVCLVSTKGDLSSSTVVAAYGSRPAFTLPSSILVNDDGTITGNTAPSAPTNLNITSSSSLSNNTVTATWTASTDAENNLDHYVVEYQTNSSGSWTSAGNVTGTSKLFTFGFSVTSVTVRVKAVDAEGLESAYATSAALTLNQPPSAPGSIAVSTIVAGESVTITLTAATDSDGSVAQYRYERRVDGGTWTEFYSENSLTATDTISSGWGTVQYRARAVDDDGAAGDYATSEVETVNSGYCVITGPGEALGAQPAPFTIQLSVAVTGQTGVTDIAVNATLDFESIYSQSVSDTDTIEIEIDTRILSAGEHEIIVTAGKDTYLGDSKNYLFTVPDVAIPDGGRLEQLEAYDGQPIFPITLARAVLGLDAVGAPSKQVQDLIGSGVVFLWSELPTTSNWTSIAFGNGKFVAVAYGNSSSWDTSAYSTDGINWTASHLPDRITGLSIHYCYDRFIVVGNDAIALYSTDGISWESMNMPTAAIWESVTYGNGKFVAIAGNNNNIAAYSTDGITWTQTTLPEDAYWNSVAYGKGKFVAVAGNNSNNIAAYSTDGINWTQSTMPANAMWYGVSYGNGKFVAVSRGGTTAAYSADGISWTLTSLPISDNWEMTAYGNDVFVAVGSSRSNFAYSSDGIQWIQSFLPSPEGVSSSYWSGIAFGNGSFVITPSTSSRFVLYSIALNPIDSALVSLYNRIVAIESSLT